jgi:hypothetical protein
MLRTALLAALALSPLLLVEGCIFGCGGYSGGGDHVYQNADDTLIVCSNGGFVTLASGSVTLEGFTQDAVNTSASIVGTDSKTGAIDFELYDNSDGTVSIPSLAPGEWSEASLDAAQLDHYDWYCQQLTTQSWWSTGSGSSGSGSNQ